MGCAGQPVLARGGIPPGTRWRMSLVEKRPCDLGAGELRRIAVNPAMPLVGYYWGCPVCGYVNLAVQGHISGQGTLTIDESGTGVWFSAPVKCVFCDGDFTISESTAALSEGCQVRSVKWRQHSSGE